MFFSFEGIDGSGKSTQARLLADALRQRGYTVLEVREPGGTDLGEHIRALLLDSDSHIADRAELLLFSAARAQLVTEVIRPALSVGSIVIADRYIDSSTAYQGGGRGLANPDWMNALHRFATEDTFPDRTYLIDLAPAEAASRREGRDQDRMEQSERSFYDRVRETYLVTARDLDRIHVLHGADPIETTHDTVLNDALLKLAAA